MKKAIKQPTLVKFSYDVQGGGDLQRKEAEAALIKLAAEQGFKLGDFELEETISPKGMSYRVVAEGSK